MCSLISVDDEEVSKAKGVNKTMKHKEFVDILINEKVIRHNMKRIQSKLHGIGTYDQFLFCLSLVKYSKKNIFNRIYYFLLEEDLLNPNQSGFHPSDSCINQLLAITHEIFEAFDCNRPLEVRSVFLYISKAFDKV